MSRRRATTFSFADSRGYIDAPACTVGYSICSSVSAGYTPARTPISHAQCAYCATRYYLGPGDRMNCTQCGAPL